MNNDRRKAITGAIAVTEALKGHMDEWSAKLDALKDELTSFAEEAEEIKDIIEGIRDEEQEYIDNLPENLQQSERAQNAEEAVRALEAAIEKLDELVEFTPDLDLPDLDEAVGSLDEAKGY